MSEYGGPHTEECLRAPWGAFKGQCLGPHWHGWGLSAVVMEIRRRCIADPLFLASEVLSCVWQENLLSRPSEAHRIVAKAIVDQKDLLYVDARGTAKTTLNIETGSVWQLLKYPNDSIVFFQSTEPVAKQRSGQVRNHFICNPRVKAFFPEYHMDTSEKQGDVRSWNVPCRTIITPEGSFDIATPGSSRTGNHYDVWLASDLMNPETTPPPVGRSTVEEMKAIIAWTAQKDGLLKDKSVNPRVHARQDSNRWHDGDLAGEIIRRDTEGQVLKVIRGVKKGEDGRFISTWPEVISSENLHAKRASPFMNAAAWAANFQSDPRPEDEMGFKREQFHWYGSGVFCQCGKQHPTPKRLSVRICVDPAFADGKTEKKATDRSAMVCAGYSEDTGESDGGDLYVLEARAGRWGPKEFVDNLFEMTALWKPKFVGIEDTSGSRGLVAMFMAEIKRNRRSVRYRKLKPLGGVNGGSKANRAVPLLNHAQNWGIYLKKEVTQEMLMDELLRFGVAEHDDLADALSYVAKDWIDIPAPEQRQPAELPDVVPAHKNDTGADRLRRVDAYSKNKNRKPWQPRIVVRTA